MANKRIKDLSTTAAVTASDDFIAVDGATNGTRKLDAYSPTFGGNLTVSGGKVLISYPSSSQARVSFGGAHFDANSSYASYIRGYSSSATTAGLDFYTTYGSSVLALSLSEQGNATIAGNLTVSGTGGISIGSATFTGGRALTATTGSGNSVSARLLQTGVADWEIKNVATTGRLAFQQSSTDYLQLTATGNLLLGTTTDGGQKLQVSGSAKIGSTSYELFGTDGTAQFYAASGGTAQLTITSAGNYDWRIRGGSTSMTIVRDNTDMLTFDGSSNATFAGTIKPQQAATASAPTYVKGAIYFDTTLNKLRVGGATGWETITSV